jgi:uncharacterized protein (DUF885 family)
MKNVVLGLVVLATISIAASSRANDNGSLEERRKQFNQLLADEWDYEMREAPEFATIVGDYRYNDRWSNLSLAHVAQQTEDLKSWQSRFEAVDTANFSEQDKISQQIMVQGLRLRIEGNRLKTFEMPIDQFFGMHLLIAQMVSFSPFDTTKQYEDYLARLGKIPTLFDQIVEVLRQGEKDKLTPPRFLLEKRSSSANPLLPPPATPARSRSRCRTFRTPCPSPIAPA